MKIALVSARADPYISPIDVHGGTVLMLNLIKSLVGLGHKVDVYTRLDKDKEGESIERRIRARRQKKEGDETVTISENSHIFRIPYESYGNEPNVWLKQMDESFSFLQSIEERLNDNNYDAIHYFHLASIAGWYNKYQKPPFVKRSTFSPLFLSVGRKFETLSEERITTEKRVLLDVPIISCQSEGEINTIKQYHQAPLGKLVKIPLGVDTSIYYPKSNFNEVLSRETVLLICPNNIKQQKRQLEVLKITNSLITRGYSVKCVFIGSINSKDYYDEMISYMNKVGLRYTNYSGRFDTNSFIKTNADIILILSQQEKILADIIRSCDIAVLPSIDEGFSLLNLDCMSCGTMPICSDIMEYSEYMLPDINAIAIDNNENWEKYVNAIVKLIENKQLIKNLSQNASLSAKKFSWGNLVKKQIEVYQNL